MKIEVQDATAEDIDRLTEIYSCENLHRVKADARNYVECYLNHWNIKVARIDGIVQGACFWRPEGEAVWGFGWIEDLWVEPEFRNQKVGELLIRAAIIDAEKYFAKKGVKLRLFALTVDEPNMRARSLYEKVGFEKVAILGDIYTNGVTSLFYVQDLRKANE